MSAIDQTWTVERSLVHVGLGMKRDVFSICLPDGENFAEVFDREDAGEIACLMAAAPDMLAAMSEALFILQSVAAADPSWTEAAVTRDRISNAIVKARGQS